MFKIPYVIYLLFILLLTVLSWFFGTNSALSGEFSLKGALNKTKLGLTKLALTKNPFIK